MYMKMVWLVIARADLDKFRSREWWFGTVNRGW